MGRSISVLPGSTNNTITSGYAVPVSGLGFLGVFGQGKFQVFDLNGTFTVPAGVSSIRVRAVGGGGGGSYYENMGSGNYVSGGCGGGYAHGVFPVTAGANFAVTVGLGGVCLGSTNLPPALSGGTSSFGALISATGGGANYTGVPGNGVGGSFQASGGYGYVQISSSTSKYFFGGGGAGSQLGTGGSPTVDPATYATGKIYGLGGCGVNGKGVRVTVDSPQNQGSGYIYPTDIPAYNTPGASYYGMGGASAFGSTSTYSGGIDASGYRSYPFDTSIFHQSDGTSNQAGYYCPFPFYAFSGGGGAGGSAQVSLAGYNSGYRAGNGGTGGGGGGGKYWSPGSGSQSGAVIGGGNGGTGGGGGAGVYYGSYVGGGAGGIGGGGGSSAYGANNTGSSPGPGGPGIVVVEW